MTMKRQPELLIIAIFIAIFLTTSCSKDENNNPTTGFYPLKTGVEWTYSYNDNSSFTLKITGNEKVHGQDYWIVKDSDNEYYAAYRETDEAVFEDEGLDASESAITKFLLKSANIGDTWNSILRPGYTKEYKLLAKENLTISGIDYLNCYKILCTWKHDTNSGHYVDWHCSGYGLVKSSETDEYGNVTNEQYTYFLTSFKE